MLTVPDGWLGVETPAIGMIDAAAATLRSASSISDRLWRRVVTLPCSTNLTDGEIARVIDHVLADPEFNDDR